MPYNSVADSFQRKKFITRYSLQAKIDGKSAILLQRSQFNPKFQVEGDVPQATNNFCMYS